jgi:DNA-binding MarR family transcriptional regulator
MRARFLRSIRLLAECYQAFERTSGRHVREMGLTPAQFDIVVTLGDTPGMTFKELGEQTLITKGTLTGVIDRLEERGSVVREPSPVDGRSTLVRLTPAGEALYRSVFPKHIGHLRSYLGDIGAGELDALDAHLTRLRAALMRDGD